MISKVDLVLNHHRYAKAGVDCEVVEVGRKYTTFKRHESLKENPKQKTHLRFKVANYLLPIYFYAEGEFWNL